MPRSHPLWQLLLARLREFYREPEVIFWVYGFPLILAVSLGIAFWDREPEPARVDIQRTADPSAEAALQKILQDAGLVAEVHDAEACRKRLRVGKTTLVVVPTGSGYEYVYDKAHEESRSARNAVEVALLKAELTSQSKQVPATSDVYVNDPGSRYIDFLIPGLMGMNLLGGGLWGVGFVIVDMRVRKLFKRLVATPMRRSHFLLSIVLARGVFMVPEMALLLLAGRVGFDVPVYGSLLTVALVILAGAAAFDGIGLLLASRAQKTESIAGLINLVMLPMYLLSGTFFSSKRFPDAAQPFIQALPLTQFNDALREVMLEGATLDQVAWRLGVLVLYAVASFALALKWFRWQ
jgi:ABC-type multidrug transport system permease subunit